MTPTQTPSALCSNGTKIPIIGLGTWKSLPGEVGAAVEAAIECGYRHFDCAFVYQNEAEVGQGLRNKIADGTTTREELYVTSKLWNTFHRKDLVVPILRKQLDLLGLEYLDLYLIHWPMGYLEGDTMFPKDPKGNFLPSTAGILETWAAMEECVRLGLTRSIGVSNFNSKQLEEILANCSIKPVMNQVECHPYLNQSKLIEFCKGKDIVVTAYSPLGSPDRPWAKPEEPILMEEPKLKAIAAKYSKTAAQVLLRYQIQRGVVVIPKSVSKSRIESNLQLFDFQLSKEDMLTIDSFDCGGRFCSESSGKNHHLYPFNIEF